MHFLGSCTSKSWIVKGCSHNTCMLFLSCSLRTCWIWKQLPRIMYSWGAARGLLLLNCQICGVAPRMHYMFFVLLLRERVDLGTTSRRDMGSWRVTPLDPEFFKEQFHRKCPDFGELPSDSSTLRGSSAGIHVSWRATPQPQQPLRSRSPNLCIYGATPQVHEFSRSSSRNLQVCSKQLKFSTSGGGARQTCTYFGELFSKFSNYQGATPQTCMYSSSDSQSDPANSRSSFPNPANLRSSSRVYVSGELLPQSSTGAACEKYMFLRAAPDIQHLFKEIRPARKHVCGQLLPPFTHTPRAAPEQCRSLM